MKHTTLILAGAALAAMISCTGGSNTVPLPDALHRIEQPDSVYTTLAARGMNFAVNADAETAVSGNEEATWINMAYPQFGPARVYLTLSPATPATIRDMIVNRTERMAMNVYGAPGELTELTSDNGWRCQLLLTRSSLTTPVQILATHPADTLLLSGALYLNTPYAAGPDSVAPIVDAVKRDLTEMLKHL